MQGKRLFYFGDFSRYSPGGAGRRLYTPPVETPAPAHPDGLHITGSSAGRAQMQGRPRHAPTHTPKRWTRWAIGTAAALDGGQLIYHAYCDSSITGMV